MARWYPWGATRKVKVKLKSMRLHGFGLSEKEKEEKVMAVEVIWKKKSMFQQHLRNVSMDIRIAHSQALVWEEDHIEHTFNFSIPPLPLDVSFHLLIGEESSNNNKKKIGSGTLDLGELLMSSEMDESEIHHSVPITYQFDAQPPSQSTLEIVVSLSEMKVSSHTRSNSVVELPPISDELNKPHDSFMLRAKSFGLSQSKKKRAKKSSHSAPHDSDESESSSMPLLEDKSFGFWIWGLGRGRNKPPSFKRPKTRDSQLMMKIDESEARKEECPSTSCDDGNWELKEVVSRDGRAKLKAKVFFGSYDQRSHRAAGESACAAIVAVFAHWLQSNPHSIPTRAVLDQLIADGSSEWRRLCKDESRREEFPDSHLDLDTVLKADLRPVTVLRERSHVGFFSPEEFDCLKEFKSLDDIWKEVINDNLLDRGVYIVSWNDHFFVLKVGPEEACYIIDSLGERLHEGCDRAYILEFNDSSVMYEKKGGGDEEEVIICMGKECCREYMKRFLAAIAIRELKEEEEDKGLVCSFKLHQRLQIEFHYSSSSAPSATTSRTESPMHDIHL